MHLGVCYYPEQWQQHQWESDARRMAELGISRMGLYKKLHRYGLIHSAPAQNGFWAGVPAALS